MNFLIKSAMQEYVRFIIEIVRETENALGLQFHCLLFVFSQYSIYLQS